MLLAVASKPADSNTTFTVGADVSRFQRSTVPAKKPDASGAGGSETALSGLSVGPTVRVARGVNVTVVPVGAK